MTKPMLLLPGALGSATQFDDFRANMPEDRMVYALNFPGHGGTAADAPFSVSLFSDAVLHFMDQNNLACVDIFGYSMGGYVALWFAWKHPERVHSITTYGTKLAWDPEVAAGMSRMFDPEKIAAKAPPLAESLAKNHGAAHWQNLCHRTAAFLQALGNGEGLPSQAFGEIKCPVTIGWGDLDQVVSESESRSVAQAIPQGRFEKFLGGKHLLEQVDAGQLARFVNARL
jgi:pimeloyl-ACP methyl ester carboxylesterase